MSFERTECRLKGQNVVSECRFKGQNGVSECRFKGQNVVLIGIRRREYQTIPPDKIEDFVLKPECR